MHRLTSHLLLALMVVTCLTQTGCIERRIAMHFRYDEKADTLAVMYVYTHVLAHDKEELDWLLKQWEWREKLIPLAPMLWFPAFVREADDAYRPIDLNDPSKAEPPKLTTDVPLDAIGIQPGEFFQGPDDSLCYTHLLLLPGKVLDAALAKAAVAANQGVAQSVVEELKRRADGGKIRSWKDCRDHLAHAFGPAEDGTEPPADAPDPIHCLSPESLAMLQAAAEKREIKLQREGANLAVTAPLTEADRRGLISALEAGRDATLRKAKEKKANRSVMTLIESAAAKDAGGDLLRVSLRLPRNLDLSALDEDPPLTGEQRQHLQETLVFAKANNIVVRTDLKISDITEKFHAGK